MVHLSDTAVKLRAVMCSVRFPISTRATPYGSAVVGTYKYVLAVELFESGTIRIDVGFRIPPLCFHIRLTLRIPASAFLDPGRQWNHAGICAYYNERSDISKRHKGEEEVVKNEDGDGSAIVSLAFEKELNCCEE